jgi:hypothetical protein
MAAIDLKNALVYLKDGSADVGNAAIVGATVRRAAAAGEDTVHTTMTGNVKVNQTFTITGETGTPPTHTVRSFTQQAGNTTSITFYPPLTADVAAAAAMTIPLLASTGANILEVKIGEGNLTYSEKRNIEYRRNRGKLDTVREGDEEPVEVNFDFVWEYLRSDTGEPVTIEEALKKKGGAADWVSSSIDPCEPYCLDIEIRYHPPCDTAKDEIIVLEDFRWESLDHNLSDGAVACKGHCNITAPVVTRVEQTALSAPMFDAEEQMREIMERRNESGREAVKTESPAKGGAVKEEAA